VAVLAAGRLVASRLRRPSAGALVVATAVVALGALGWQTLYVNLSGPHRGVEWMDPAKIQDAATAAAYLDAAGVPAAAPVVFVVDDNGPNPLSYVPEMAYMLRSVLPVERIPHAYIYVGNPTKYLAGLPTYRDHPGTYNVNVARFWPTIQAQLPRDPVAILLASYDPLYGVEARRHPDWVVAPNLVLLNGPRPTVPVAAPVPPQGPRTVAAGAGFGAGTLVVMTLIGLGWAAALLPPRTRAFEVLALAPAIGLAFLILAGVVLDAVGVRLVGWQGAAVPIITAVGGGVLAVARRGDRPAVSPAGAG
jgi:hypothetical protein